jgi:hypothetical protein
MPSFSTLLSFTPYHILAYGTLLGMQVHQSFIAGIVAYRALPRPQFSVLQKAIFPIYFMLQTSLSAFLFLSYPGEKSLTLSGNVVRSNSGLLGVFSGSNKVDVLIPLSAILISALLNTAVYGPKTTMIMNERKHQETKDGKKSYDPPPHSKEMQRLNREFGKAHGMSSLANLAALLATMYYGVTLAEQLN